MKDEDGSSSRCYKVQGRDLALQELSGCMGRVLQDGARLSRGAACYVAQMSPVPEAPDHCERRAVIRLNCASRSLAPTRRLLAVVVTQVPT